MSTKAKYVLTFIGLGVLSLILLVCVAHATVGPVVSRGAGPATEITIGGYGALIASLLGAIGFPFAGLITFLSKFDGVITQSVELFIPDSIKPEVKKVVDVGAMAVYVDLYNKSKLIEERKSIKAAAQALDQSLFSEWFPDDAPAK